MEELSRRRRESQPLHLPSAGSTFKRPKNGYAASLIEQAGLKGYAVGGAAVSEKHAGFVVNTGGATFSDVMAVMDHVRGEVLRQFGIELEPEVKIVRRSAQAS
jgi:UDP-N-acetylmuramate dehydrogenase